MTLTVVVIVALVGSGLLAFVWSQQRRLIYFPSPGPLPSATIDPADRQGCRSRYRRRIAFGRMVFPCAKPRPCPCGGDIQRQCRLPVVARRPRGGTEPTRSVGAVVRLPGLRRQSRSPNRGGFGGRRSGRAGVAGGATGRRPEPDRVLRRIPGRGSRSRAGRAPTACGAGAAVAVHVAGRRRHAALPVAAGAAVADRSLPVDRTDRVGEGAGIGDRRGSRQCRARSR